LLCEKGGQNKGTETSIAIKISEKPDRKQDGLARYWKASRKEVRAG
jgi:hypothetical protein